MCDQLATLCFVGTAVFSTGCTTQSISGPSVPAASPVSGETIRLAAARDTAKYAFHVYSFQIHDYVEGALVTATDASGNLVDSGLTSKSLGRVQLELPKDGTFSIHVSKDGFCSTDVTVVNEAPRKLWVYVSPGC